MLALILATALTAQATNLNYEMESAMIDAINEQCNVAEDAKFQLNNVEVSKKTVDQNVADYFYTATFTATYLGKDEFTIVNKQLKVKAVKWAIGNPEIPSVEVLSVSSTDKRLCD